MLIATNTEAQKFRFVVFGDSQLQNPEVFETIVYNAELLKPDLYLHVGDMIHGYTYNIDVARRQWKIFNRQIGSLQAPFYPTPGNHDVTTKEIQPAYFENWGKDRLNYSFQFGENKFIVLNAFEDQDFYNIHDKQIEWLYDELANSSNVKNIFLSIHPPLYLRKDSVWQVIHTKLLNYPVRAVFTGHNHIYDYRSIDGIDYFCLNSSGNLRSINNHLAGSSHHFLFVTVENNKVDYAVISEGKFYKHDAVNSKEKERASNYWGTDRTISLSKNNNSAVDTVVSFYLNNRADEKRKFYLDWLYKDERIKIVPAKDIISIGKLDSVKLSYKVSIPTDLTKDSMPKLKISSDYRTLNGFHTESTFFIRLFYPPSVYAIYTNEKITLDGRIDENIWDTAGGITELFIDDNFTPAEEKTLVKILYDDKYIYVGIVGEEPNPKGLTSFAYGDIPLVFGDDDFELFFDTNRDMSTFYRLMTNPSGTVLNSGPEGLFSFEFDVKTFVGNDYWSAEFKVPFAQLNIQTPNKNDHWGFNVRRHRQQSQQSQSDWSKMQTHPPYQPEYFGLLIFK